MVATTIITNRFEHCTILGVEDCDIQKEPQSSKY
jgi:hypothetical protein